MILIDGAIANNTIALAIDTLKLLIMTICGLKLTHDASIALIDDQKLIFSYEIEKLNNSPRYTMYNIPVGQLHEIFREHGYSFHEIDKFVIDGWNAETTIIVDLGAGFEIAEVAGYGSLVVREDIMMKKEFSLKAGINYSSYLHVAGHVATAYCSSPMAKAGEDSYVLIWDGGMYPQLFYYHARTNAVENIDVLFPMIGNVYAIFAQHFAPFLPGKDVIYDDLSVAGKVMAYIGRGTYKEQIIPVLQGICDGSTNKGMDFAHELANEFIKRTLSCNYSPEDILCTFHVFIEQLLVEKLKARVKKGSAKAKNLCFAGGSALNIKWNSAIRNAGIFNEVWVPPFPNDSGSAIGAACCGMIASTGANSLDWDVYSGPLVLQDSPGSGWIKKKATIEELALLLFLENEPVVFMNGRAELGPRALGNRSILAPATDAHMKQVLNYVKNREEYRPVAPICLEEDAQNIFSPGSRDPYMVFDHLVRPEWKDRIPAICHLDGTARLQTVNESENPVIYHLLREYKKLSGIPLLCNTSANYSGKGFFPDVLSAMKWNKVNYVWCDNALYEKEKKISFSDSKSAEARSM